MNNRSRPSTSSSTRFARRVGGLLSVVAPPNWVRSVGLHDHPRHGRVVAAHRARRISDDASPALELISVSEQEPPRIGGGDGGGAVEAADDGAEVTGLQWPSEMI
ncbi:hypothetical protein QJS10_CPA10g02019 [Acorus calamus]|uniref:Uncharacterized protein n=1 Tax=Acorus calamus TaxID=4465 RepID=A0AAV9DZ87_ACOCL|nr:hypothetical protein QJS10_CPA10g02019 [Acorus calamus]